MIKKIALYLALVATIAFGSFGCMGDTGAEVTPEQFSGLKGVVDRLVSKEGVWDGFASRITLLENRGSPVSTDLSGVNTNIGTLQSKVATLETDIDTLKKEVNKIKDSNSAYVAPVQPTNQPGSTGNIPQFTPGTNPATIPTGPGLGVTSQVNYVSGNNQLSSYPGGSNNIYYVQRLINQNTAIQYVKPIINISMATNLGYTSGYASENITSVTVQLSTSMCSISGTGNFSATNPVQNYLITGTGGNFNVIPGLGTLTSNIQITPASGCLTNTGELYLSPGGYTDLSVQISNLIATPGGIWNVTPSCSYHP